jgi:site-specific recombinase XerC
MLPGIHKVRASRADGGVTEFWYAWRGGPRILRATARSDLLLAKEVERLARTATDAYNDACRPNDKKFLYGLITRYLESPKFLEGGERTKRDRRKYLDRAREELGEMALKALEARGARKFLIDWRDRYKSTPKTADELLGALSAVLEWARDRGEIGTNPAKDFPRIYHVNRADVIWTPEAIAALRQHCAPEMDHAVRLAALAGLRLSDLRCIPWTAVGEHAIVWQTGKSKGRRTIIVPIYDGLRELLTEIPRIDSVTILNSARKRPWSEAGLESAMQRAKSDAAALAIKEGRESSPIAHLRWHDLRGTAATNFIRAGLDLNDVATILGWKKTKVEEVAARYVTSEEIGLAMIEKLRRNMAATEAVKSAVKSA